MTRHLTTGGARDPFLSELLGAIRQANAIDLAVAFVRSSGLALLYPALADAVELRGARVRILTSDYLDVTEPAALRRLMLLAERGVDLRLFESDTESFHLKAYLCMGLEDGRTLFSRAALLDGLEWNLRVTASPEELTGAGGAFQQIREAFEALFDQPRVRVLDHDWIDAYEHRRQSVRRLPVAPIADEPETPPPAPNPIQVEALSALAATRAEGFQRGLVVMATGLDKTFLAAFDSQAVGARRVLGQRLLGEDVSGLPLFGLKQPGYQGHARSHLDPL